jgi:uncharacterized membrane protein
MVDFRYGPVELYLVGYEGERPDPLVVGALAELLEGGLVRLLDVVLISKDDDGEVTIVEIEDENFGGIELAAAGIAAEDDIAELAELIEPGTSAALVALELLYARRLAERLATTGATVLSTERIPAPVVNALLDAVEGAEKE